MELSSEDALRLNVLLANQPLAIRINESRMTLEALLRSGGATSIQLNPAGSAEKYLRAVRALLSAHALGNPGGYPLYLQRWTRMGQMREESLEQLLLLGEPTAVFAVVCASGLTDELARRAWWAHEDAENARRMLCTPEVAAGETGPLLARYLVEFLPFETDSEAVTESVRMALQPGLLSREEVEALWKRSARKSASLVGFMWAIPDDIPEILPPHPRFKDWSGTLQGLSADNPVAAQLLRLSAPPGQAFLETFERVLRKPPSQDVVSAALEAMAAYLRSAGWSERPDATLDELAGEAERLMQTAPWSACAQALPEAAPALRSMALLSCLNYGVLRPVFSLSDAIGSLMRKKLLPVTDPLLALLGPLRGR